MLAEEKEVTWDVVTCVNQKNFKDLMLFKDFLIELGVKNWRIFTIFPVGRAAETPELQIDDAQFTWVLKFIRHCRAEGKYMRASPAKVSSAITKEKYATRFFTAMQVSALHRY